jgi:tRNA-specific 2-thiouridylase
LIKDASWLEVAPGQPMVVEVKLRSMTRPVNGTLIQGADGRAEIHLNDAQYGISPGQAAACYLGNRMIGGGWIVGTARKEQSLAA